MYSTYTVVKLVYDEQNIMQIINIMFCVKPILTKCETHPNKKVTYKNCRSLAMKF